MPVLVVAGSTVSDSNILRLSLSLSLSLFLFLFSFFLSVSQNLAEGGERMNE